MMSALHAILLQVQVVGEGAAPAAPLTDEIVREVGAWELTLKGGWPMIPLALLLVVALYLFFERWLTLRRATRDPRPMMDSVKARVLAGDIEGAKIDCAQHDTPMARIVLKGLNRIGSPLTTIEASIENTAKEELYRLEKGLSSLSTVSGVAPMIGFLGTVLGMIETFITVAQEKSPDTADLAGGLYQALVTTVGGLIVGIIAYAGYNFLTSQVQKAIHRMETTAVDFLDLLQQPQHKS